MNPILLHIEIRFSRSQQRLYQSEKVLVDGIQVGGVPPAGETRDWPDSRPWAEGLLAMCLFDVEQDAYVGLEAGLAWLRKLQASTVAEMLAELVDQIHLAQVFEESNA